MPDSQILDTPAIESSDYTIPTRLHTKPQERFERAIPLFIFLISLSYLWLFRRYSSLDLDEGIILQAAERVLRGQVPYRDFFLFYTPGSVYIQAALFKLFGDSFAVARTAVAVIGAVSATVAYCLARRVCSRNISLFAAGLTTGLSVTFRFVVVHNWYSTVLAILTTYAAVRFLESDSKSWAFATGSLVFLVVWIEQSKGLALCGGLVLGYSILHISKAKLLSASSLVALVLGFLWLWPPTLLYFGWQHALRPMFQDLLWPIYHYGHANHVFYGHVSWGNDVLQNLWRDSTLTKLWESLALSPLILVPALPLAGVAWLIYVVWKLRVKKELPGQAAYYVLVSAISASLLVCILMVRTDVTAFMYETPFWYVILAWSLQKRDTRFQLLQRLRPAVLVYVCLAFGIMSFDLVLTVNGANARSDTRRGVIFTDKKDAVIQALQTRIPPKDELLVFPYAPLYNYLTATYSPSSLDFFQPGMNTHEQASAIVESLSANNTRWVLFEPSFAQRMVNVWPGTPIAELVYDPVGEYIARNYRLCEVVMAGSGLRFNLMTKYGQRCEPTLP